MTQNVSYVGLNLEGKMIWNARRIQGLSNYIKAAVRDFYYQPDISYAMPGMTLLYYGLNLGNKNYKNITS